jgi:hypothetical protein
MKTLIFNLLLSLASGNDVHVAEDYRWVLDEINTEVAMDMTDLDVKVKIFDATGNLVKEISKTDYLANKLSTADRQLVRKSSLMFEYLGDSYLLMEN